MKEIHSKENQTIKEIKKLQKKKYRKEQQKFILEGFHLVEEAIQSNAKIEAILLTEKGLDTWQSYKNIAKEQGILVPESILKELSEVPSPQGILAVVRMEKPKANFSRGKWLLLDNVQDPGNVGTMIRTADAFGFGVVLGAGCADVYNGKTMRSMQGSNFHLPIIERELSEVIRELQTQNISVYATVLKEQAQAYKTVEKKENLALVMGSEGRGIQPSLLEQLESSIYIAMSGHAESLNVAVAAGILMAHFA